MRMEVRVYSTPTCPYCKMTKAFLKERNIDYADVDITTDRAGRDEMIKKSGQMGVPVIYIDGKIVVGFDRERIERLIEEGI
jgi:glutaredoxin 3